MPIRSLVTLDVDQRLCLVSVGASRCELLAFVLYRAIVFGEHDVAFVRILSYSFNGYFPSTDESCGLIFLVNFGAPRCGEAIARI